MVKDLVAMGFDESRSKRALKHFRNNMNVVTDYLLGQPEEMDDEVF
jgi:uncharacterized UBP type Zn finger protein